MSTRESYFDLINRIEELRGRLTDLHVAESPDPATQDAVARELAAPQARLLYATTTAPYADRWHELHDRFDVYMDPELQLRAAPEQLALEGVLDGAAADAKRAALRAALDVAEAAASAHPAVTVRVLDDTQPFLEIEI